jgi:hypothetical protein
MPLGRLPLPAPLLGFLALGTLALAGCGDDEAPRPMELGRHREAPDRPVPPDAGTRERLGLPPAAPVASVVPTGWTPQAPGSMRLLSYRIAGSVPGDLSVSVASGTVLANVNRWRNQVGLEPLDEVALAALPRVTLLGSPAVRVEARGTYQGMQGDPQPDFAVLGLVSERGPQRLFVKLVGPAVLVDAQSRAFDEFVAGLREADDARDDASAPPPEQGIDPRKLRYDVVPTGWKVEPATKPFRLVEMRVDGAEGIAGVVSLLSGDGGGLANNLNRWRGQMGAPELGEADIAALERIDVLGGKAVWIEIPGHYRGMGGEDVPDALFLGVVRLLETDAFFVRLYGPKAAVEGQREALKAFVRGIRLEG